MNKNNTRFVFRFARIFLWILLSQHGTFAFAQYTEPMNISRSNAYKMLEVKNYHEAIRQFTALLKADPANANFQLALGKAYNYSHIDHKKAIEILEPLCEDLKRPQGSFFELGVAYHKNYYFDKAIEVFEALKKGYKAPEEIEFIDRWIATASRAQAMMNEPVEVILENLGEDVNSDAPDFLPFAEPDESALYFTTKREGVVGNLYDYSGYRTADVYMAKHRSNDYGRARSVGNPNTYGNEYTAGRSENGEYLAYQINSKDHFSDLFISEKGRRSYMSPKEIDSKVVNQKSSSEISAAITNDGKKIYFSSDRDGGYGGFDMWIIRKLPIGIWSEPQNLGPMINTAGDEKYPFLRGDGSLMYFSSDGHPGMGGMDLFVSEKDSLLRDWEKPQNMGYPVNTPHDDLSICYATHSRYAYIGTNRGDSYGDLDIYRLIFKDVRPEYTLVSGSVRATDSSLIAESVLIEAFDLEDESLYGAYIMSERTGRFHAILPPGRYRLEIHDLYGYQDYLKEMTIYGKNDFIAKKQLDIVLQKDDAEGKPELNTRISQKKFKSIEEQ